MMYKFCFECLHECDNEVCKKCHLTNDRVYPSRFEPLQIPKKKPDVSSKEVQSDPVNHPAHYETGKFECIEVMKEIYGAEATQNFCLLNAFKYLYRCNHKNNKTEDIKKADWYINKYLELESEKHGKS